VIPLARLVAASVERVRNRKEKLKRITKEEDEQQERVKRRKIRK